MLPLLPRHLCISARNNEAPREKARDSPRDMTKIILRAEASLLQGRIRPDLYQISVNDEIRNSLKAVIQRQSTTIFIYMHV